EDAQTLKVCLGCHYEGSDGAVIVRQWLILLVCRGSCTECRGAVAARSLPSSVGRRFSQASTQSKGASLALVPCADGSHGVRRAVLVFRKPPSGKLQAG